MAATNHHFVAFFYELPLLVLRVAERATLDGGVRRPDLVGVARGALPSLHDVGVRLLTFIVSIDGKGTRTVGKVETEASVSERNAVVTSVEPLLGWKVVVALPDLHLHAVTRSFRVSASSSK